MKNHCKIRLMLQQSGFLLHVAWCYLVNVVILVLLAVAILLVVERNLLNLGDLLHRENQGRPIFVYYCTNRIIRLVHYKWRLWADDKTSVCFHWDAGMVLPFELELSQDSGVEMSRKGQEIPVVITAAEERLGAVVAAMNSIYQNSKANVAFTIVTTNDTVDHLK